MTDGVPVSAADKREAARTCVRVVVTLAAGAYAFLGPIAIAGLALAGVEDEVVEHVTLAYGLSAGLAGTVVGYWFNEWTHERMRGSGGRREVT